jgi:putative nucleotidyltransferase with HDIG domain
MAQNQMRSIIDEIDDLKTLPSVYIRLSGMIENPNATVGMIGQAIAEDQAIAAKVLKLVNSAFYGFPRRIANLKEAIIILGLDEIKTLVLGTSVLDVFLRSSSNSNFDMKKFWEHSIACAVASKIIAEAVSPKDADIAFVSGLLHDIGKLVHAIYLENEFSRVISYAERNGSSICEAEDQILGFNHAETGGILAEKWKLPKNLLYIIKDHHSLNYYDPLAPKRDVAIVQLANVLSIALRLGSSGDPKVPVMEMRAWQILGLRLSNLEPLMKRTTRDFKDSLGVFDF